MKLYYSKGACSLAIRILINELDVECEYESVDLKTKKTESGQDFLTINPKGSVPTLITNEDQVLTENAVIHQYLADVDKASQLLPFMGKFERYRILEGLNFVTTELHKGFSPLFNPALPQDIKESIFIPALELKFEYVDTKLQQHQYFVTNDYTLPDGYLFVMLLWAKKFKMDISKFAALSKYFEMMMGRASVVKSLKEEGLS